MNAALDDALNILRIPQLEGTAPERMLHPGTAKLLDVHVNPEVAYMDAFQHWAGRG